MVFVIFLSSNDKKGFEIFHLVMTGMTIVFFAMLGFEL